MPKKKTPVSAKQPVPQPPRKAARVRNGIAEWIVTGLILLFGTATIAQSYVIPTGSMEDNLVVGDHLFVDKLAYSPAGPVGRSLLPYEEPKHGDIIVFRDPADVNTTLVKRVIGAPGDRLKMVERIVYRNGKRLNEPYVYHKFPYEPLRDNFPGEPFGAETPRQAELQRDMLEHHVINREIVVPPACYFAMGDNRDNSLDSRFWGFVPRENITGKPLLIYWSYRASTEELLGSTVDSLFSHYIDVGEHFFTRTRWNRMFHVIRGFPDSELPDHPLPLNPGSPDP